MVIIRCKDNFGNVADLDVLQSAELLCDVSAIESGDIGQVFGISSQEFMLPGSQINNNFFGNIFDLGSDPSVALNHTFFASVMVDGAEIFSGKMYINNVLTDDKGYVMYKALVVNETIDFNTRIENIRMNDLDLSSLNHTLSIGNVTGSWAGNLSGGNVVYPLVDYASSPITNIANGAIGDATFNNEDFPLEIYDFKPGIKVKALIDAVFATVDYNYSSSFIDSAYFDKLFILATANSQRGVGESPVEYSFQTTFSGSADQVIADGATATALFPVEYFDNGNGYNPATGVYTAAIDGTYSFNATTRLQWGSAPSAGTLRRLTTKILVNGVEVDNSVDLTQNVLGFASIFKSIVLTAGDLVKVTVTNQTIQTSNNSVVTGASANLGSIATSFGGNVALIVPLIDVSLAFGKEDTVLDFLGGLIEKFNLVIEPQKDDKNILTIEPYNTWVDGGEIVDWSSKIDNSVRKSIKGTMNDQSKVISFADKEDDDILNEYTKTTYKKIFGEALYIDDGDLTSGKRTIGDTFSPTPIMAIDGTNADIIPHLYTREGDTKTSFTFNNRILHFNGDRDIQDVTAYDNLGVNKGKGYWIQDETTGNSVLITSYGSFHYLEIDVNANTPDFETSRDLNFNNRNQVHFSSPVFTDGYYVKRDAVYEYWAFYLNSLYDPESKMLTCNIKFNPEELKDIQLNNKIFIDGHYYRINKISSFDLTKEASIEVELIKSPVRKFQFPRRRVYDEITSGGTGAGSGGTYTDVTLDDGSLGSGGTGTYVFVDDNLPVTGSGNQDLLGKVAPLDNLTLYDSGIASGSVIWKALPPQNTNGVRPIKSLGDNNINFGANEVTAVGNNNTVGDQTSIVNIQGTGNVVESFSQYVSITGDNNSITDSSTKSSIQYSTTSSIKNSTLSTIIGGENTIISGSNKSIVIGQDTITQGGNSNIVIGNYDTNVRTVKDLINTVVINPNRDLESWENISGNDFNGRAYIGGAQTIGAIYRDTKKLNVIAGTTIWLTGSEYANDFVYDIKYTGGTGTANIYLPTTDPNNLVGSRDSLGLNREIQFITDLNVDASHIVNINPSGSDAINGASGVGAIQLNSTFESVKVFSPNSGSWTII